MVNEFRQTLFSLIPIHSNVFRRCRDDRNVNLFKNKEFSRSRTNARTKYKYIYIYGIQWNNLRFSIFSTVLLETHTHTENDGILLCKDYYITISRHFPFLSHPPVFRSLFLAAVDFPLSEGFILQSLSSCTAFILASHYYRGNNISLYRARSVFSNVPF